MKTERNRKLKGTVLLTVVSIMALLIVILTSTLIMATAANRRAYKSYSSSQSTYTARATVESILAAVGTDNDFAKAVGNLKTVGQEFDIIVDMNDNALGTVEKANIKYVGKKKMYDSVNQEWVERDVLEITADVSHGAETTTISSHVIRDPVDQGDTSGGGGAPFVTKGAADGGNHTSAFGGTYFGMGTTWQSAVYDEYDSFGNIDKKEYLNYMAGSEQIYQFKAANESDFQAPFVVNGSWENATGSTFHITRKGTGIAIWGDLTLSNWGLDISSNVQGSGSKKLEFNEIPYVYVDRTITNDQSVGVTIGKENYPLNIFCGNFNLAKDSAMNIYADMYCMDIGAESVFRANGSGTTLYKWADSTINKYENVDSFGGNYFSKGSLRIKSGSKIYFKKDVRVEGDLNVESGATLDVAGDLVVGGALMAEGTINVTGHIYCNAACSGAGALKSGYTEDVTRNYYVYGKNIGCYPQKGNYGWHATNQNAWLYPVADGYDLASLEGMEAVVIDDGDSDHDGKLDHSPVYDFQGRDINAPDDSKPNYFHKFPEWNEGPDKDVKSLYNGEIIKYRDPSGNEVSFADAHQLALVSSINGKTVESLSAFKGSDASKTIYPAYAERGVILGLDTLTWNGNTIDKKSSKVLQTVTEMMSAWDLDGKANSVITSDSSTSYKGTITNARGAGVTDANVVEYDATNSKLIIKDNVIFKGNWPNGQAVSSIEIVPAGKNIWIKLEDGLSIASGTIGKILVDDSKGGTVNFFVNGDVNFKGGMDIHTKSFEDIEKKASFQVCSDAACRQASPELMKTPCINVYSKGYGKNGKGPKVTVENSFFITGYIMAPYMSFNVTNVSSNTHDGDINKIVYDGMNLKDCTHAAKHKSLGIIGCLDVDDFYSGNPIIVLYLNPDMENQGYPAVEVEDANAKFSYAAVDYNAY